jgi:glyoxylase-like metal-dependent hydrolase (beta-lactamase superfamily II)
MQILDDVYLVGSGRTGVGLSDPYDCHIYLIDGGDEAALVDAGSGVDVAPILRNLEAHGVPKERVRTLVLTHAHADHSGGAAALRDLLGCRVLVGRPEAGIVETADAEASGLTIALPFGIYPQGYRMTPCPVDQTLADEDSLRVGRYRLRVLATPGHSPGSICLSVLMNGRHVLFTGDTIQYCPVAGQVGWISMLNAPGTDLDAYRSSVRRLANMNVDVLLPGHRLFALSHGQRIIDSVAKGFESLAIPRSVI